MLTFQLNCAAESREVSLNENVFDYNFINDSEVLNIYKYLMTKNNIKQEMPDGSWNPQGDI